MPRLSRVSCRLALLPRAGPRPEPQWTATGLSLLRLPDSHDGGGGAGRPPSQSPQGVGGQQVASGLPRAPQADPDLPNPGTAILPHLVSKKHFQLENLRSWKNKDPKGNSMRCS